MIFRARAGTIIGMESPITQPESPLEIVRRLENLVRMGTVEQVRQIYGLSSANICHIVKVRHIEKIKVGVKNLLLRSDVERVMAERNK